MGEQARSKSATLTLPSALALCATFLACFLGFSTLAIVAGDSAGAQASGSRNAGTQAPSGDLLSDSGFAHFYNLEYDRATQDFEKVVEKRPEDPAAINHLTTALLMHELYRMGAMNTGEYANDSFIGQAHRAADPKVKDRIKQLVNRAEALEEQQLKSQPNNVDALYARGVTRADFSLYTALVERAWFSALRNAVGARHDHERVLELNPNYVDAKLVVGTHNYVMGSLPWSVKVAGSLVGLGGSKEKGFQYLREVANSKGENSVDAQVVLSLFLRREQQYEEARGIMHVLGERYPKNYLFMLEEANLLRAMGRFQDSAATYRKVWQSGQEGKYGRTHYEMAAWGLAELLRSQKDFAGAASAYESIDQAPDPDPETLQKANLAAGEMYDLMKKRDLALKKYETVLAMNSGSPFADAARRHIKEAYRQ